MVYIYTVMANPITLCLMHACLLPLQNLGRILFPVLTPERLLPCGIEVEKDHSPLPNLVLLNTCA